MAEGGPRVLLLGGTGFIGRHVRIALETAGSEVLDVGRGGRGSPSPWRTLDLAETDPKELLAAADPQVVINCAGRTSGSRTELVAANVQLVARLLDALNGRDLRLVHLGSSAEYGRGGGALTREDAPPAPTSAYGATKLAATDLVRGSGLDATVLRVFNPVGAGMPSESMPGRAVELIRAAIAGGDPLIRMGDLSAERDFVDVRDVAEAVLAAARVEAPPPIVNVGTGRTATARDLVHLLAKTAGFTGAIDEDAMGSPRSGAVDRQIADIRVAQQALAWSPRRQLSDAVAALWEGAET